MCAKLGASRSQLKRELREMERDMNSRGRGYAEYERLLQTDAEFVAEMEADEYPEELDEMMQGPKCNICGAPTGDLGYCFHCDRPI